VPTEKGTWLLSRPTTKAFRPTLKRSSTTFRSDTEEDDSSDQDDPPMTHEEVEAQLSEQVNITTSAVLPHLRAPHIKIPLKKACKTPPTTVTMKQHVEIAPIRSVKPGKRIPDIDPNVFEAAPVEQVAPTTSAATDTGPPSKDIPDPGLHAFNTNFIVEKLDRFIENPFDGQVDDLPIPSDFNAQSSNIIQELCSDSINISYINSQLESFSKELKDATSKFVIKELEDSVIDSNKSLSILRSRRLQLHAQLKTLV
jgi:hypothetical protein